MLTRIKTTPKLFYELVGITLFITFFTFYSFKIDEDAVVLGYRSNIYSVSDEIGIEEIIKSVKAAKNKASNNTGTYEVSGSVKPSKVLPADAGGMSIPLFYQGDSRWWDKKFGGGNMSSSACGPTCFAMVITYLTGNALYPDAVVDKIGKKYSTSVGLDWSMFGEVAPEYGCTAKFCGAVNAKGIVKALKENKPVIVSTSGYGTTREFTKKGHFIVLRGLTEDGKILVNDPNDDETKKHYAKAYDPDFIVNECKANGSPKAYWVFEKKE